MNVRRLLKAIWFGGSTSALVALGSYLAKYVGGTHPLAGWATGVTTSLIILWYFYLKELGR